MLPLNARNVLNYFIVRMRQTAYLRWTRSRPSSGS